MRPKMSPKTHIGTAAFDLVAPCAFIATRFPLTQPFKAPPGFPDRHLSLPRTPKCTKIIVRSTNFASYGKFLPGLDPMPPWSGQNAIRRPKMSPTSHVGTGDCDLRPPKASAATRVPMTPPFTLSTRLPGPPLGHAKHPKVSQNHSKVVQFRLLRPVSTCIASNDFLVSSKIFSESKKGSQPPYLAWGFRFALPNRLCCHLLANYSALQGSPPGYPDRHLGFPQVSKMHTRLPASML